MIEIIKDIILNYIKLSFFLLNFEIATVTFSMVMVESLKHTVAGKFLNFCFFKFRMIFH
jgi:hypothetical protein